MRLSNSCPSACWWRTQSLIRKRITNPFGSAGERAASSRPTLGGASPMEPSITRCTGLFEEHYGQRAKFETSFSVVKLCSRAPALSSASQIRQALPLGLAYNLYRLRHPRGQEDVNRAISSIMADEPVSALAQVFATRSLPVCNRSDRLDAKRPHH